MILRELFIRLGLDVNEQSFARGKLAADAIEKGLEGIVDLAKEAVEAFAETVKGVAEAGERYEVLAQQTGLSTDAVQDFLTAADLAGAGADSMAASISHLSRLMLEAKRGSAEATQAIAGLHVKTREANGAFRGADEILLDLADRFSKMPDGPEKTALAVQAFGRAGREMIPLLNKGREGIKAFAAESTNLTEEQIKAGVEVTRTLKIIKFQTTNLWQQAIGPLLPALDSLLKRYLAWRKANAEIIRQTISKYIGYAIKLVGLLGRALGVVINNVIFFKNALVKMGEVAYGVFDGLWEAAGRLKPILLGLAGVILLINAPFLVLAGLIAGLMLLIDDYQSAMDPNFKGKSVFGEWKKTIDAWLEPNEKDPWWLSSIKDFVRSLDEAITNTKEFKKEVKEMFDFAADAFALYGSVTDYFNAVTAGPLGRPDVKAATEAQATIRAILRRHAPAIAGSNPNAASQGYGVANASPLMSPSAGPSASYQPEYQGGMSIASSSVQAPVTIVVNQQPGQSGADLADEIESRIDDHWQSRMEEANASVNY